MAIMKIPEYIVVEGPIGVGKTTLAQRLAATMKADLLLEQVSENPFLPRFYQDPEASALPTQLYFLFQRARQIESLRQTDMFRQSRVADFLIQKDRLFAEVTLTDAEMELYYQVYNHLTLEAPAPDLVIYLQAPVDTLLRRVRERGIEYESSINEAYLKRIADAYIEFFYHYNEAPLLIVNTEDFNLASGSGDFNLLLNHIRELPPGRHFFNPRSLEPNF
ncbi:MAG: deoxyadenosine kinase [Gammaproteobacteria bacterium RIFCSPLOWO2_02_FULL_52_10]|nr:MAG: deoxyadenosine kinase [Gammaproteobacteria bacterium RIFCSPLOWO2_02_FULL_52_10]